MSTPTERLTEQLAEAICDAAAEHGTHDYGGQADAVLDIVAGLVGDAIDVGARNDSVEIAHMRAMVGLV